MRSNLNHSINQKPASGGLFLNLLFVKHIYFILFLIVGIHANHAQSAKDPANLGVGAIGLVVADLDRSEQFYRDVLGMLPAGEFELDAAWSEEAGMAGGQPFGVKMYKMKDSEVATVLKLAYFDSVSAGEEKPAVNTRAGVNYLTFYCSSLSAMEARIKAAGIPLIGRVERQGYALLIVRDPDGVFIELVERR